MAIERIFSELVNVVSEKLEEHPRVRAWSTAGLAVVLIGSVTVWVLVPFFAAAPMVDLVRRVAFILAVLSGLALIPALASFAEVRLQGNALYEELNRIQVERIRLQQHIREQPEPDILDSIQLNVNQLTEYYTMNKAQARSSFFFSVLAVVLGFVTLVAGIWLYYLQPQQNMQMSVISGASGVLLEFIGGAYFYLYRTSLTQLNFFFTQLVRMQDTMLAVKLCEQITPEDKQAAVRERIIISLLDRNLLTAPTLASEKSGS